MSEKRLCGWCEVDITDMNPRAKYCSSRHLNNAAAKRRRDRDRRPGAPRTCGWCEVDITDMNPRAKYCCAQHKKNAGSRRHRERNPGYYKRYHGSPARAAWVAANRERIRDYAREQQRRYRSLNPDAARRWQQANRDRHRHYQARRRAMKFGHPDSVGIEESDWLRLVRRFHGRCAYCGEVPRVPAMDHVVPLVRGGRHAIGNVLPACTSCNSRKSALCLSEWRHRQRRLGL